MTGAATRPMPPKASLEPAPEAANCRRAWLIHDAWKRRRRRAAPPSGDARSWRRDATARGGRLMASTPRKIQERVVMGCGCGVRPRIAARSRRGPPRARGAPAGLGVARSGSLPGEGEKGVGERALVPPQGFAGELPAFPSTMLRPLPKAAKSRSPNCPASAGSSSRSAWKASGPGGRSRCELARAPAPCARSSCTDGDPEGAFAGPPFVGPWFAGTPTWCRR